MAWRSASHKYKDHPANSLDTTDLFCKDKDQPVLQRQRQRLTYFSKTKTKTNLSSKDLDKEKTILKRQRQRPTQTRRKNYHWHTVHIPIISHCCFLDLPTLWPLAFHIDLDLEMHQYNLCPCPSLLQAVKYGLKEDWRLGRRRRSAHLRKVRTLS